MRRGITVSRSSGRDAVSGITIYLVASHWGTLARVTAVFVPRENALAPSTHAKRSCDRECRICARYYPVLFRQSIPAFFGDRPENAPSQFVCSRLRIISHLRARTQTSLDNTLSSSWIITSEFNLNFGLPKYVTDFQAMSRFFMCDSLPLLRSRKEWPIIFYPTHRTEQVHRVLTIVASVITNRVLEHISPLYTSRYLSHCI